MANDFGVSWTMVTAPFTNGMAEVNRAQDRASRYALRATGRYLARVAKTKAPVYSGDDPRATAESGNLRKSIKNSRRMVVAGDNYSIKVGPFGSKKQGTAVKRHGIGEHPSVKKGTSTKGQVRGVQLYRAKMEERYGFMQAGVEAASGFTRAIFEEAYAKAFAKYR